VTAIIVYAPWRRQRSSTQLPPITNKLSQLSPVTCPQLSMNLDIFTFSPCRGKRVKRVQTSKLVKQVYTQDVCHALLRMVRFMRTSAALLMALGLAILANGRPYEGLTFDLPVAIALLVWMFNKDGPLFWTTIRRFVASLLLVGL
jgi:hypothetical protein